ncbi:MAG: Ig domain-containing protein [Myxococcales bacterium]|jgi:hypothetical protein
MRAYLRKYLAVTSLFVAGLTACSESEAPPNVEPQTACKAGSTMCFEQAEYILQCVEDGSRWEATACEAGKLCHNGSCKKLACVPNSRVCEGNAVVACNEDGTSKLYPHACSAEYTCHDGQCLPKLCEVGEIRCKDSQTIERCEDSGTRWAPSQACDDRAVCFEGVCLPANCSAGQTECGPTTIYTCGASGTWTSEPCPDSLPCLFGRCVACVGHDGCAEGEICDEGACVATAPELITETLPAGTVGAIYSERIEVSGGKPPYTWSVADGALPAGLTLGPAGELGGTPTAPGTSLFRIKVEDSNAKADERGFSLEIMPAGGPLTITTTALPPAEHGLEYQFTLQATGGVAPYAWQVIDGALPVGLALGAMGQLVGAPEEIGTFPMTVRVLDALTPPGYATKELSLVVEIAPLVIVGEKEFDLLLTKIIVLPMLVQFVPYSTQLEARGGLRPYTWSEEPAPPGLSWVIPTWGPPDGMTIDSSGLVSGWVTDTSDATVVQIPFTDISVTGYFFSAKVTDSQSPAESATAIYCIPTVPLL